MQHKLSIIMPCYNCASTLEEAVASIYEQNFTIPYEVVMVNDGSTDSTEEKIKELAKKYPNISYYNHDKNRGGGAARNTAVSKTTGDIIFSLDSDDAIPKDTLQKMVNLLINKECDGVVFEGSLVFTKNKLKSNKNNFNLPEGKMTLLDYFEGKSWGVGANFLYTKKIFAEIGGYPTEHNFDTQGFGIKFLSSGLSAYKCPGAYFYQRQFSKNKSYFERSFDGGESSLNTFYILKEILFLFSPKIREKIIKFNSMANNGIKNIGMSSYINNLYKKNPGEFFIKNYKKYLILGGEKKYIKDIKKSIELTDLIILGNYFYKKNNYAKSIENYFKYLSKKNNHLMITYLIINTLSKINHGKTNNIKNTQNLLESLLILDSKKNNLRRSFFEKIISKLKS